MKEKITDDGNARRHTFHQMPSESLLSDGRFRTAGGSEQERKTERKMVESNPGQGAQAGILTDVFVI